MSDKSGIEWTEATWNPATGCTKVSPGCKYCYAKHKTWPRLSKNPSTVYYGREFEDVQVHPERIEQPLRWTKPRMIFVNSMSDLFHEDIPDEFIAEIFAVMNQSPRHIFQILTKRSERMRDWLSRCSDSMGWITHDGTPPRNAYEGSGIIVSHGEWPLPNVWLGVSVENQELADERIPLLLETPAAVRWLSCEPLIDRIILKDHWMPSIDWVVVGGESGMRARPMMFSWAQRLCNICLDTDTPFFMKQGSQNNWVHYKRFESFPRSLQVREYPRERL